LPRFGVAASTVTRIIQKKEKYNVSLSKKKVLRHRTRLDAGKHANLEELLFQWLKQKRSLGISIAGPMIQEKALFFNHQLGGPDSFKASQGWLEKFKRRFGIRQISVQGESLSANKDGATQFQKELKNIIENGQYSLENIYNADETGLYVKMLPKKTLALMDEKQAPGLKDSKERVTVMNCANATGTHKIPLLLIGRTSRPRCFKGVNHLPLEYRAQTSSWMNGNDF